MTPSQPRSEGGEPVSHVCTHAWMNGKCTLCGIDWENPKLEPFRDYGFECQRQLRTIRNYAMNACQHGGNWEDLAMMADQPCTDADLTAGQSSKAPSAREARLEAALRQSAIRWMDRYGGNYFCNLCHMKAKVPDSIQHKHDCLLSEPGGKTEGERE